MNLKATHRTGGRPGNRLGEAGMASTQIRIERKSLSGKSAATVRKDAPLDLRSPSGRKLPY